MGLDQTEGGAAENAHYVIIIYVNELKSRIYKFYICLFISLFIYFVYYLFIIYKYID